MGLVVLVTGVSGDVPARVAAALAADPRVDRVLGLAAPTTSAAAPADPAGVDVVRVDPRGGAVATVVARAHPDVVVHLGLVDSPARAGGRAAMKEINVIGTMQLLAARASASSVQRVVIGSTSAVYGASPRDAALVDEDAEPVAAPRSGWGKDCLEVEAYARGLARRRRDIGVLALRPAELLGPQVRTPLTEFLALPVVPTVLGFDPRLQFLHVDDAVDAAVSAAFSSLTGAVNLAGDGVLLLSQAAHLAGRPTLPLAPPLAGLAARGLGRTRVGEVTADQQAFLRFGRGLDTTRMRKGLGFTPRWTTRAAYEDFVRGRRLHGPLDADRMARVRASLGGLLGAATTPPTPEPVAAPVPAAAAQARGDAVTVPDVGPNVGPDVGPDVGRGSGPESRLDPGLARGLARAEAERARRRARATPLVGRRSVAPVAPVAPVEAATPPPPAGPPPAGPPPAGPPPAEPDRPASPPSAVPALLTALAELVGGLDLAELGAAPAKVWSALTGAPTSAAVDAARLLAGLAGQGERVLADVLGAAGSVDAPNALRTARELLGKALEVATERAEGDYEVDEFGFDAQFTDTLMLPALRPLYRHWFRVEVKGIENLPADGPALLVANHSGAIALDSLMLTVAVHDEHPAGRHLRMLGADLVFATPVLGELSRRGGVTLACMDDALRLLRAGHLVGVWPEGFKGVGKPFSERYKLQRFGRGGFVAAALRTGTPIVPVAIVGAEETYPIIGDMPALARLFGLPYAPVTPTWPLLGPLGLVPLPSKWTIQFCPPMPTTGFGPAAAEDPLTVFDLTDQVRHTVQQALYDQLVQRRSVFL